MSDEGRGVIDHWKNFHLTIAEIVGSKFNEVNCTIEAAKRLRDENERLKAIVEKLPDWAIGLMVAECERQAEFGYAPGAADFAHVFKEAAEAAKGGAKP